MRCECECEGGVSCHTHIQINENTIQHNKRAMQKKTVTRLGAVWGVIGVTVAAITSSGKSFDRMNAPGYAEQAAKKQAGKQAIIDKAKAEKEAMRAKRAAAAATQ